MKIIAFSSPDRNKDDISDLIKMLKHGLDCLHIRKPHSSREFLDEYLNEFPERYKKRIVLHSFHNLAAEHGLGGIHLTRRHRKKTFWQRFKFFFWSKRYRRLSVSRSYHSLSQIEESNERFSYVFLSPVFDSISKMGHNSKFSRDRMRTVVRLSKHQVIALGGIRPSNVNEVKEMGFSGVGLLGTLWEDGTDAFEEFKEVYAIVHPKK